MLNTMLKRILLKIGILKEVTLVFPYDTITIFNKIKSKRIQTYQVYYKMKLGNEMFNCVLITENGFHIELAPEWNTRETNFIHEIQIESLGNKSKITIQTQLDFSSYIFFILIAILFFGLLIISILITIIGKFQLIEGYINFDYILIFLACLPIFPFTVFTLHLQNFILRKSNTLVNFLNLQSYSD
ncbi:MAG: hypothetical protein SFU98_18420 [Leptospiraceae bacterium]|nr:hypothetical protein [Leptospiraceae bacterium]